MLVFCLVSDLPSKLPLLCGIEGKHRNASRWRNLCVISQKFDSCNGAKYSVIDSTVEKVLWEKQNQRKEVGGNASMDPELSQTTRHNLNSIIFNFESRIKTNKKNCHTITRGHPPLIIEFLHLEYSNPSYSYFTAVSCRTL